MKYLLNHPRLNFKLQALSGELEVPALPDVYLKIRQIIESEKGDAKKASEVLTKDPSLVMKVLKAINSAAYGFRETITNIEQAVALLGFNEISNLVFASTVIKQFPPKKGDRVLNLHKFWEHSIGVAVMTRILQNHSRALHGKDREEAFVGGLIHDVGKLMMLQAFPEDFTKALNLCKKEQILLWKAEQEIFGFNHQDIGAYVADEWGFSRNLVKAIELHNSPDDLDIQDESFIFVSHIHVANVLAHFMNMGNSGHPFLPNFHSNCFAVLNTEAQEIEGILAEGRSAYGEVATAIP